MLLTISMLMMHHQELICLVLLPAWQSFLSSLQWMMISRPPEYLMDQKCPHARVLVVVTMLFSSMKDIAPALNLRLLCVAPAKA
jgi:hypothetical protein